MKEFLVYNGLRLVVLVATFAVIAGIWDGVAGSFPFIPVVIIACLLSGVISWFVLARPRAAYAARVEQRASRAVQAFEARRAREDD